ncbi:MAG: asparagine synthase (glutamine-hydrolyzing), partial [Nitrospinaceae bacterium]|nr:asparagine synthase (glutamine-hydrolyzing) [Nitrospinaceae bacterium]
MCGFVGFVDLEGSSPPGEFGAIVDRCAETIRHRGPNDDGTWVDVEAGVALGFRRLSIIDLSESGHQPMRSACGRYVIVYNGEIYNFRHLREELKTHGFTFHGTSDTEVLLAGIAHWGIDGALKHANGMFALALWDRENRSLTLARDRIGQKPLYYGWSSGVFFFGSEIKAIERHPAFTSNIDRNALALMLRHGYIPAPSSIYSGLKKLLPGTSLTMSSGNLGRGESVTPSPYWSAVEQAETACVGEFKGSMEDAVDELEKLLKDAVDLCMVADVPVGAFLSGGVDSSVVVALMQELSPKPVKTFSIGFHESIFNEAEHAKAVAAHLGTDHTELYITEADALAVVPELPTLYDEPFADSSQIPTHIVSRLAREKVTVSLSGDGGDELFCGYNRYIWADSMRRVFKVSPHLLRLAASAGIKSVPVSAWNALAGSAGKFLPQRYRHMQVGDKLHKLARLFESPSIEEMYLRLISLWQHPEEIVLDSAEAPTSLDGMKGHLKGNDFRHRMMLMDTLGYLPDDILVKVDRAAMGVSLESRIPLLDHRIFEFAWSLPLSYKLHDGASKRVLRQVLYRHVPPALIERPKMG